MMRKGNYERLRNQQIRNRTGMVTEQEWIEKFVK